MATRQPHPVLILAALGAISGTLGTSFLGVGVGSPPRIGAYMVLTGLWFGLVIGFAVWHWARASLAAVAAAAVGTWIAWEVAVNLAIQIDGPVLRPFSLSSAARSYICGFAAGAAGACITWAAASLQAPALRQRPAAIAITATGAVLGMVLLQATNVYDTGWVLLVPWQAAVAGLIGRYLADEPQPAEPRPDIRPARL